MDFRFYFSFRFFLLGSLIFTHLAIADEFSEYRARVGYEIRSSDSDSMESESRNLKGKIFFSPVNTRNDYPMGLQEYFNRSSSVYLSRTAATQKSIINARSHHLGKGLTLASAQNPLVFSWSKLETQDADVEVAIYFPGPRNGMADQSADSKSLGIYIDEFFVRFSRTELESMLKYKYGERLISLRDDSLMGNHYYVQTDTSKTSDELAVMYTDRIADGSYLSAGMALAFTDIDEDISDLDYFYEATGLGSNDFPGTLVNNVLVKRSSDEELWRYYATWYPNRYSYLKAEYSRGVNQGVALQGGTYFTYRLSAYLSFYQESGHRNPKDVMMAGLAYLL